jgi:hypothetical protein
LLESVTECIALAKKLNKIGSPRTRAKVATSSRSLIDGDVFQFGKPIGVFKSLKWLRNPPGQDLYPFPLMLCRNYNMIGCGFDKATGDWCQEMLWPDCKLTEWHKFLPDIVKGFQHCDLGDAETSPGCKLQACSDPTIHNKVARAVCALVFLFLSLWSFRAKR